VIKWPKGVSSMKYKCLVLDHDDTVVHSTPDIHYPSFVEALKTLRPEKEPISLKEFVHYCFSPGFSSLCSEVMGFNEAEQAVQYRIWRNYVESRTPSFFTGMPELITDYRDQGGLICVVSHSESQQILRDYRSRCNLEPDMVFGWELEESQRKPNPYPLEEIMRTYGLKPAEMLVVDDLKPGLDMARSCRVDFAGAGWSHIIPEIAGYMRKHGDFYFEKVDMFRDFILS
jgi:phosphoglycolate phosphatase-like HAD superfamily hydrolase